MFSENMLAELNKQYNYELYSGYLYMAMEPTSTARAYQVSPTSSRYKLKKNGPTRASSTSSSFAKVGPLPLIPSKSPRLTSTVRSICSRKP